MERLTPLARFLIYTLFISITIILVVNLAPSLDEAPPMNVEPIATPQINLSWFFDVNTPAIITGCILALYIIFNSDFRKRILSFIMVIDEAKNQPDKVDILSPSKVKKSNWESRN